MRFENRRRLHRRSGVVALVLDVSAGQATRLSQVLWHSGHFRDSIIVAVTRVCGALGHAELFFETLLLNAS